MPFVREFERDKNRYVQIFEQNGMRVGESVLLSNEFDRC